jgi:hypothetical protein
VLSSRVATNCWLDLNRGHQNGHQISWSVELAVKPGQFNDFPTLTGEMVEAARHERGARDAQRGYEFMSALKSNRT